MGLSRSRAARLQDPGLNHQKPDLMKTNLHSRFAIGRSAFAAFGATIAACGLFMATFRAQAGLVHRYSFDEAPGTTIAGDFYGGADGTLMGGANFTGGGDILFDGASGYVNLPNGIISALNDATFEAWVTWSAGAGNWQRIFDFGNSLGGEDTSGVGSAYIFFTPRSAYNTSRFAARPAGAATDSVGVQLSATIIMTTSLAIFLATR